jgi:hypothetical protein
MFSFAVVGGIIVYCEIESRLPIEKRPLFRTIVLSVVNIVLTIFAYYLYTTTDPCNNPSGNYTAIGIEYWTHPTCQR